MFVEGFLNKEADHEVEPEFDWVRTGGRGRVVILLVNGIGNIDVPQRAHDTLPPFVKPAETTS